MFFVSAEDQQEHQVHKQQKRREGKRPDLQRYQSAAGRRHRDEDGEIGRSDPLATDSNEHDDQPSMIEKKDIPKKVVERHECTNGGTGTELKDEEEMRGEVSNSHNSRKGSQSQDQMEANQAKGFAETAVEHTEAAEAAKPVRKTRKPDREFYQPGNRRNIQGKDCGVAREQDKPPSKKTEPDSQLSLVESEDNKKTSIQKQRGKKEVKCIQNVKLSNSSETNRKQGSHNVESPPLSSDSVEKITSKVEKLSMKEKVSGGFEGQVAEELSCRRSGITDKERKSQGGGKKDEEEKVEKKRDRRRRGAEREKERNRDYKKAEDEVGSGGKNDRGNTDKERSKKGAEADRDHKPGKTGEMRQSKGRENHRESRKGDNNSISRDAEKDAKTQRNIDRAVDRCERKQANANFRTPTSKRYSKSDIRRSRNRTYSSSSASSVTSLDGPGLGLDVVNTKWAHLEPRHNNKEGVANREKNSRGHLQSWTTNEESSTESLEGSEMSDIADDRRRRRTGEKEPSAERQREERNRSKGNKGGGRGILRVPLEKQSHSTSSPSGPVQHSRQGAVPRGRGGGILVLPARTDISNSSEAGQRLLFGNRGGAASRSRGGRGGGVRRLWDPNNPDQKPALTGTQSSQHSALQQPAYLQTGTGYGQLHFLDTDDEVAGSPPVPQGEHFRSQQAAAMAYYKFQNSDNPYCYPMPTSNPHSPGTATSQRYPYPYHMGPYQIAPSNGMYTGPGVGQFCGNYRGAGYSQSGAGGTLPLEEVGRLLRAADAHELQLSNLLSRDRVSAEGLERMAHLR